MTSRSVPESSHDFYHLQQPDLNGMACRGLACFAARADAPQQWQRGQSGTAPLYCLGQCYCAPAVAGEDLPPLIAAQSRHAVLLGGILAAPLHDLSAYQQAGGGQALRLVLASGSAAVIPQIAVSGLRGRGGAAPELPAARGRQPGAGVLPVQLPARRRVAASAAALFAAFAAAGPRMLSAVSPCKSCESAL